MRPSTTAAAPTEGAFGTDPAHRPGLSADFSYGSTRTQLWLWRVHRLPIVAGSIQTLHSCVRSVRDPTYRHPLKRFRPLRNPTRAVASLPREGGAGFDL